MPEWVVNAIVIAVGIGIAFGALRNAVADLKADISAIKTTTDDTSLRLVKLETRLEGLDSLRFDERLRLVEMALAEIKARHNANDEA